MPGFLSRLFALLSAERAPRLPGGRGRKAAPPATPAAPLWGGIDAYRRAREPSPAELLRELKNTAFTCASINAAVCASFPPKLYVATAAGQPRPKCGTEPLPPHRAKALAALRKAERVELVTDHPLLALLERVNPAHNLHDLLELTTLYQEVHGSAYWLLEPGPLGVPEAIWPLPSHLVRPLRAPDSPRVVDAYEYRGAAPPERYPAERVVHFRYPNPRDPYCSGLAPLQAVFEQAALGSEFLAFKQAVWNNAGLPGVILSPAEVISDEERRRLELEWEQKFRRGGQGRALVADTGLSVDVVEQSLGDLATLAEQAFTKEEIANAFGVPLAFLTKETNLANLQASRQQHAALAIRPRLRRRDEKLNEQLVPLFDPSGRLFFRSDDPVSEGQDFALKQEEQDLRLGVRTINEVRAERGLDAAEWGRVPWLPLAWARTDFFRREDYSPGTGRNRDPIDPEDVGASGR
ncbi:MAG TPA: phage portal protein [Gemmataceae bacterium]